jgi:hypothetical protein
MRSSNFRKSQANFQINVSERVAYKALLKTCISPLWQRLLFGSQLVVRLGCFIANFVANFIGMTHVGLSLRQSFRRAGLAAKLLSSVFAISLAVASANAPVIAAEAPADTSDVVECANLIYSATKSSVCFSEEFLSTVAAQTSIKTARKFKPVKLGEKEVFRFPFAVMTGEGVFVLTDDERKNLRLYLEKGGFLLASAGCSSKEWSDSFAREMQVVFPEFELEEVPLKHPIFRTVFDVSRLDTKHEDAKLMGLNFSGKIVLIFSADGLNDTATMHGCCCCGGNEIVNSQKVNANIIAYALLQ